MNSQSIPSSYTRLDRSSNNGTNSTSTSRNGNTRSRRRPRWHRGSRLPSGILPPLPSLDLETNTNTEDCVANALAVLRSTKRPKYCVDEQETQQQYEDENDIHDSESNSPQTPSIDNDTPRVRLPGSLTAAASTEDVEPHISRPKGWEWSVGILPPQSFSEDQIFQQRQQEECQYSRLITPLLYSAKFPSGRNCSSFLLSGPSQGGEGIRRLVAIRPRLERHVTP